MDATLGPPEEEKFQRGKVTPPKELEIILTQWKFPQQDFTLRKTTYFLFKNFESIINALFKIFKKSLKIQ